MNNTAEPAAPAMLRGVALVIHGLNVKPERLQPLADELRHCGIAVVRCALRGHGENYTPLTTGSPDTARLIAFRQVNYAAWHADVATAYQQAVDYAESTGAPIFLVAFSLGALLGCDLLATIPSVHFARMVLLAPALAIRPYCHLPWLLSLWPQLPIRSFAPSFYRANPVTPVAAYQALYTALRHLHLQPAAALNVPTLVLIDPADELVSTPGIQRFIHQRKLSHWQLQLIRQVAATQFHHLILDPASVGQQVWQRMIAQILLHLVDQPPIIAGESPNIVSTLL